MHSKSDNIEIMINDEADEVIEELFKSLIKNPQIGLEKPRRSSDFIFNCVHLLYYNCDKRNLNRSRSYIESPDWIKSKKATINPIYKKDNKSFQYSLTVALNHLEIKKYPQRITQIKPFINKYNWEGINSPSEKDD